MRLAMKALLAAALAVACLGAWAQSYPTRPVTLIVPFAAGGPTDVVARTLGAAMMKTLGQTVVIENKLGAGGTIAANYVAKANPDGYTMFIHHNGMATATGLYRKLPFNPLTDFDYIGQVADVPMTLIARKDFPANNLREFNAYVRANKDKINLANAGLGAVSHLCGMLLQQALGVELTTVPFQGTAPAMTALLGGQVDILCDQTTQTIPIIVVTGFARTYYLKGFFTTPYGRDQWVSLWVDGAIEWKAVAELVERSYRVVALKRMIKALDGQ